MARRQIVSLSESSLKLPDDELTLPRMTYFSGHDLAFTSAHRKPASRFGFSVFLCYLRSVDFPRIKNPTNLYAAAEVHSQQAKIHRGPLAFAYLSDMVRLGAHKSDRLLFLEKQPDTDFLQVSSAEAI